MLTERRDDIQAFRAFIDEQISDGGISLTPADVLDLWEIQNTSEVEREETWAAILQGLSDANESRVRPFEEFDREFRQNHGLSVRS